MANSGLLMSEKCLGRFWTLLRLLFQFQSI